MLLLRTGIGTGWVGCGMDGMYARPAELDIDYGHPVGDCAETAAGSEVFARPFSNANVSLDCKRFVGTIDMTAGPLKGQTLGGGG